jgi:hypothetical protein
MTTLQQPPFPAHRPRASFPVFPSFPSFFFFVAKQPPPPRKPSSRGTSTDLSVARSAASRARTARGGKKKRGTKTSPRRREHPSFRLMHCLLEFCASSSSSVKESEYENRAFCEGDFQSVHFYRTFRQCTAFRTAAICPKHASPTRNTGETCRPENLQTWRRPSSARPAEERERTLRCAAPAPASRPPED